jgi:hypothetical protein
MPSSESASKKISRKPDEKMELKRLVRNVHVEVDIVDVLDRIVNSIGWNGSGKWSNQGILAEVCSPRTPYDRYRRRLEEIAGL